MSSATVNLTSEIAVVSAVSEEKTAPNWQKQLGEALAQHLTTCGFTSSLPVPGMVSTSSFHLGFILLCSISSDQHLQMLPYLFL